jgi:predicted aldo/keto reductase-like oxidoreductase
MPDTGPSRRDFMKSALAGLCIAGSPRVLRAATATAPASSPATQTASTDPIPRRVLGRTGVQVSILGLGGDHIGRIQDEQEAIRVVHHAVEGGVTFLDTAWTYNAGRSEVIYGKALKGGMRDKIFLMSKAIARTKGEATRQLEESLRRLQVDHLDLWQFHAVNHPNDPKEIFAADGAIEAAAAAQKAGKIRFLGFTGHREPQYLLEMLEQDFAWDTVQMPINALDPHYKSFGKQVLPRAVQRGMGVIAMKTLAWGWLMRSGTVTAEQGLAYAWSQPVSLAVVGMDSMRLLEANIATAKAFRPMGPQEQQRLLESTREVGSAGQYEPHKTAQGF